MNEQVLLIDDEQDFSEVLAERMRERGMHVTTTSSPLAAVDLTAAIPFDAVILDLIMPEMNGLETLARLKETRPTLQIIVLTGQASISEGIEAMQLGAMDFLEKPIDIQVLTEKIQEAAAGRTRA